MSANRIVYGWEDPLSGQAELSPYRKNIPNRPVNRYDTRAAAEAEIARRNPRPPLEATLTVKWEQ